MAINVLSDLDLNNNDILNSNVSGGGGGQGSLTLTLYDALGSWHTLDEVSGDREDSHINSLTLTESNVPVIGVPGLINNAAQFDPVDQSILQHTPTGTIYQTDTSFSWAGWVVIDNVGSDPNIVGVYGSAGNRKWVVDIASNELRFVTSTDGTVTELLLAGFFPSNGVTYHIAVTYDGNTNDKRFYVDGSQTTTNTATSLNAGSTAGYDLGGTLADLATVALDGTIDEAGYWSRALTADEVSDLYNSGAGITYLDLFINGIEALDDGTPVESSVSSLDFTGTGVTVTRTGLGGIDVAIPGGASFNSNKEILSSSKTLVNSDDVFQALNPNGTPKDVIMPIAPVDGSMFFWIINDSDGLSGNGNTLNLKEALGGPTIITLDDTSGLSNIRVIYVGGGFIWF